MRFLVESYNQHDLYTAAVTFLLEPARQEPNKPVHHEMYNRLQVNVEYLAVSDSFRAFIGAPRDYPPRGDVEVLLAVWGVAGCEKLRSVDRKFHDVLHYCPGFAWQAQPFDEEAARQRIAMLYDPNRQQVTHIPLNVWAMRQLSFA